MMDSSSQPPLVSPPSTWVYLGDGQVSVQEKLLIESLFMQVPCHARTYVLATQCENDADMHYDNRTSDDDSDGYCSLLYTKCY